jgi:hypothetical protein
VISALTDTVTSRISQLDGPVDWVRQVQRIGDRVSPTKLPSTTLEAARCMSARTSVKVRPWTS